MLRFEKAKLVGRLASLSHRGRVAFAAACAERLAPAYRLFERGPNEHVRKLEQAVEHLWSDSTSKTPLDELEAEIEGVMEIIPQEDDFPGVWVQEITNAQNAGMAVVYALRARLTNDVQEAAWAAQVAYEALDNFVVNKEDVDMTTSGGEMRALSHDLVQAELARQQRDLADLEAAPPRAQQEAIERIRQRAKADAARFFECRSSAVEPVDSDVCDR